MKREFKITAAAIIFMAIIYYIAEPYEIAAILIPAAVHEMGHIGAIKILGLHIKSFSAELKGFCIDYYGSTAELGHILIGACGPAAGFIYAYAASKCAEIYSSDFLALSAGVSLLLSLFNLLPVLPLDGGRIAASVLGLLFGNRRGGRIAAKLSTGISLLIMAAGIYFMVKNRGIALLTASVWLLFYGDEGKTIVKPGEIL